MQSAANDIDRQIAINLFMFFLGAIQLIWALIHPISSKNPKVKKLFGYYWMGVVVYFIVIIFVGDVESAIMHAKTWGQKLYATFYYVAAFGLAFFHLYIVGATWGKGPADYDELEEGAAEVEEEFEPH